MNLENIHKVYFIGIGGIGMSALARWFHLNGFAVSGYDRTESFVTKGLTDLGIEVHFKDEVDCLSNEFKTKEDTLVVYTPAIPHFHKQYNYFKEKGFVLMKRAEVLGLLTKDIETIGVAGTHGKTTTSSLLAHLLKEGGVDCIAFLGGIPVNYQTNFIANEGDFKQAVAVVEADEFDRSFLQLYPNQAIVTSMEADHLDIYNHHAALVDAFKAFTDKLPKGGRLVCSKEAYKSLKPDLSRLAVDTYSIDAESIYADKLVIKDGKYIFDYVGDLGTVKGIALSLPGLHNVENALAAITIALDKGVPLEKIKPAIDSFKGIKRRFEFIVQEEDLAYIDDYAHHPSEIDAVVLAARQLYPNKKLAVVFQPHLFSRTRDFMKGFVNSLSKVDELYLLDVYPAREVPITGVTSEAMLDMIPLDNKMLVSKENVAEAIGASKAEILMTLGAGDIDQLTVQLKEVVQAKLMVS